jgi:hypothetical protein
MKNLFLLLTAFAGLWCSRSIAQPNETVAREKLQPFSAWVGRWQGEGSMQMGPGEPKESSVDEKVEFKLNGTVMLVEGVGKATNPSTNEEVVVHHALGLLSYDQVKGQYTFRTYLKDGRNTDAWLSTIGENKFQWGFDIPTGGKTRYTISLDPNAGTWNEIGEFSRDGNTWSKFFEMNLKKIE